MMEQIGQITCNFSNSKKNGGKQLQNKLLVWVEITWSESTEEFNVSANVITAGAWASGGNLNTGRI